MKKLLSLALCAVLLHMNAAALPAMGELTAKSAALYDASGQMLYEMNAEESLQPASVTKIMTLLLAMEALDRGEVQLDTMVTGSAHAASMGGTQIWLKEGEQLPFDEMLKAMAVGSANDCAVAVAEHLYGSEEAFVQKMNERAKELGCTSTTFVNANGLDADGQKTLTSARDLALISAELLRIPKSSIIRPSGWILSETGNFRSPTPIRCCAATTVWSVSKPAISRKPAFAFRRSPSATA